jgi:hypothetical protein
MPKSTRWRLSSIGSLLNRCLAVGLLLIFVACGSDESKTVTTATTAVAPLNACELVTSEDAQKLLDEPATKSSDRYPMNRTSPDGKTWFSTCGYTGSTSGRDISIMVRYADALIRPARPYLKNSLALPPP